MQLPRPSHIAVIAVATLLRFSDTSCVVMKRSVCGDGIRLIAAEEVQMLHVPSETVCALLCRLHNCCVLEYTAGGLILVYK